MKKRLTHNIASFLIMLVLVTSLGVFNTAHAVNTYATKETVTLVADKWCPYTCEESNNNGFMIEIAREIFKRRGIYLQYKIVPWTEAITKTREGQYNAIVGALKTDAPDFVFPNAVAGFSDMRFWVKNENNWSYNGVSTLKNIRIGAVADYSYSAEVDEYLKANAGNKTQIQYATSNAPIAENIERLKAGKIDAILEDDNVMNYYISSHTQDLPIKSAGSAVGGKIRSEENYLYIAFSPKDPKSAEYARIFDEGMAEIRSNGTLRNILDIYQIRDWYNITKK